MPLKWRIVAALMLTGQFGCGTSDDPTLWASQNVIGGELSGPADDGVVQLLSKHEVGLQRCTGALLAPNLVLTAKHCVANHDTGEFDCDADGNLAAHIGGTMGTVIAPKDVRVQLGASPTVDANDAVGTQIFSLLTTSLCRNDIALVVLDRSIPNVPTFPLRVQQSTRRGEPVLAIGYGVFLPSDRDGVGVRHRKSGLVVEKVGSSRLNPNGDAIPPQSFQVNGGSLCMGDSGGPAIADSGAIIGVYSKSNGDCSNPATLNWYTETSPFADELIRPAFVAAGAQLQLESASGSAGMAGSRAEPSASAGSSSGSSGSVGTLVGGQTTAGGASASDPQAVYDRPLPDGGTCRCRAAGAQHDYGQWLLMAASAIVVAVRRASSRGKPSKHSSKRCPRTAPQPQPGNP